MRPRLPLWCLVDQKDDSVCMPTVMARVYYCREQSHVQQLRLQPPSRPSAMRAGIALVHARLPLLLLAAIQAAPSAFVAALAVVTRSSMPHGCVVAGTRLAN